MPTTTSLAKNTIITMRPMWSILPVLCYLISITRAEDACKLTPDPGPCTSFSRRWFFNQTSKTCESFTYGGCGGTVPFATKTECVAASCNPCTQIPETGPCEAAIRKFFFNNRAGKCQPFTWGGCAGTVPFETRSECEEAECVPQAIPTPTRPPFRKRCSVVADPGPCLGNTTRWYWDEKTHNCQSFRYGGCFGSVPFRWVGQCERAGCGEERCAAVPDGGPCEGAFTRWFYNGETDACESFAWGGCGGTVPFVSRKECEASLCIKNRCKLEPDAGPCDGALTKFFFNQETGTCDSFSWGGCFGLVPFHTRRQCMKAGCEIDRCRLRADRGPCERNKTRWWFDASSGECESFKWGGCQGRAPFETKKECREAGCTVNRCRLRPDSGFCRAFFLKWFWNEEFEICDSFVWGGCGGVVPFSTRVMCEEAMCGVNFGNNDHSFSMV